MSSLLDDVNGLLNQNQGDSIRLQHIKKSLEENKIVYLSDRKYVTNLMKKIEDSDSSKSHSTKINYSKRTDDELYSDNENVKGIDDADIHEKNPSSSLNTQNVNSFCGKCGKDMGSDSFCSKCGQSNQSPNLTSFCGKCGNIKNQNEICKTCDGKNNSTGKKSKKVGKVILYLFGLIVMVIGLMFFGATMNMPMIFAGQYLMLSLFILVIGGIIIYAGKRIK